MQRPSQALPGYRPYGIWPCRKSSGGALSVVAGGFAHSAKGLQLPVPRPPGSRPPQLAHTERRHGRQHQKGYFSTNPSPGLQPVAFSSATASPFGGRTRATAKTTYVRTSAYFRAVPHLSGWLYGNRPYGSRPCRLSSGGALLVAAGGFARTKKRRQLPDVPPTEQHTLLQPPPNAKDKYYLYKTGNKGNEDTDCTSVDPYYTVR